MFHEIKRSNIDDEMFVSDEKVEELLSSGNYNDFAVDLEVIRKIEKEQNEFVKTHPKLKDPDWM